MSVFYNKLGDAVKLSVFGEINRKFLNKSYAFF